MSFETVGIIGLGYIGLPTAAMFASHGKQVIGVDVDRNVVDIINRGHIHIVEPELEEIVRNAVAGDQLRAVSEPEPADAFLISVPTPFKKKNKGTPTPDLSFIENAANSIAPVLKRGDLVVLESTSPVGATEKLSEWLAYARPDLSFPHKVGLKADINIAHCPERVLPGQVVKELVANDRVVGGLTTKCSERAVELYRTFVSGKCVITDARTAELAKLTENASRDVQIAFANELSIICDELNINVWELISIANRHPRVNILQPGPGVGGHCIAVDPWFIASSLPRHAKLITTARQINDSKPNWVIDKFEAALKHSKLMGKKTSDIKVAILGLSFKANIDDLRESPAREIAEKIAANYDVNLLIVEPNITKLPSSFTEQCSKVGLEYAIEHSKIILILVDHADFMGLKVNPDQIVIDTKGILNGC